VDASTKGSTQWNGRRAERVSARAKSGFDCAMTRAVSRATKIPIIASGGAGKPEHFIEVLTAGEADAALAASIFHYGTYTVDELKAELEKAGIPVRRTA
jgi:cyclase